MADRLRLIDFSDREILAIMIDATDGEGWITAEEFSLLPELSFLQSAHKYPQRFVGARFAWLAKFGVLERERAHDQYGNLRFIKNDRSRPAYTKRWRVTRVGEALVRGTLTEEQLNALEGMGPTRVMHLTRWVTTHARRQPAIARKMMQREWVYGTSAERYNNGQG